MLSFIPAYYTDYYLNLRAFVNRIQLESFKFRYSGCLHSTREHSIISFPLAIAVPKLNGNACYNISLEASRQDLTLKASTVILASRIVSKGETTKKALLEDPAVKTHNPNVTIKVPVMKVDMDDYNSVRVFSAALKSQLPIVNFLPKFEKDAE